MSYQCPRCKQKLVRTRRRGFDHWISKVLPMRRFQCVYHTCRWSGLRFVKRADLKLKPQQYLSLSDTEPRKDQVKH